MANLVPSRLQVRPAASVRPGDIDLDPLRQLAVELAAEAGAVTRSPLPAAPGTTGSDNTGFVLASAPGVAATLNELLIELEAWPPAISPDRTADKL